MNGRHVAVVTWIPRDAIPTRGLPRGSICGALESSGDPIDETHFRPNRDFIDIVHYLNANHLDPDLIEIALHSAEQTIAVIDQRCSDVNGSVPAEDVIGTYEVEKGRVVGYRMNPHYRLITAVGRFQLTPWLRHCLTSAVLPE